jgi:hypothetical protein
MRRTMPWKRSLRLPITHSPILSTQATNTSREAGYGPERVQALREQLERFAQNMNLGWIAFSESPLTICCESPYAV